MRKAVAIAICMSVLHAGALWALEGCLAIGEAMASAQHSSNSSNHGHSHDGDAQHSHSDPTEVHCPNPLAAFVSSQRVSVERERGWVANVPALEVAISAISKQLAASLFILGPPGLMFSTIPQRFLLLSIFRI
jgi:hypothetical protein